LSFLTTLWGGRAPSPPPRVPKGQLSLFRTSQTFSSSPRCSRFFFFFFAFFLLQWGWASAPHSFPYHSLPVSAPTPASLNPPFFPPLISLPVPRFFRFFISWRPPLVLGNRIFLLLSPWSLNKCFFFRHELRLHYDGHFHSLSRCTNAQPPLLECPIKSYPLRTPTALFSVLSPGPPLLLFIFQTYHPLCLSSLSLLRTFAATHSPCVASVKFFFLSRLHP